MEIALRSSRKVIALAALQPHHLTLSGAVLDQLASAPASQDTPGELYAAAGSEDPTSQGTVLNNISHLLLLVITNAIHSS